MLTKIATDIDFVVAKTRAMRSWLYEGDRLSGLLRHRELPDLAHELFPLETFASHMALEQRLVERFAESLAQMWRFFPPPRDRIFVVLALRLQVENLKVILRSHLAGRRVPVEALPIIPLPDPFSWPLAEIGRTTSVQEILDAVPERTIRTSAVQGLVLFNDRPVPLYLEAGLDQGYLRLLAESWAALGPEDRVSTGPLVDFEIDVHNLMLVLRARVNHGVDPGLVVRLAAAETGHHVPPTWVAAAAQGETARDIISAAPRRLRRVADPAAPELPDIERAIWQRYYAQANRIYYRTFFSLGCPYAFSAIRRMELANVITVVESVRYGLTIEESTRRFLRPE